MSVFPCIFGIFDNLDTGILPPVTPICVAFSFDIIDVFWYNITKITVYHNKNYGIPVLQTIGIYPNVSVG